MQNNPKLEILPQNPWLAPLAGWSNLAFRQICREQGAYCTCTEMVSAKGLVYGGRNTEDLLNTNHADNPLVVQIFGAEAEFMERGISILQNKGFYTFDINVGCSVQKVIKTGAGAAMLKDLDNLLKVAKSVIEQVHKPEPINDIQSNLNLKSGQIGLKLRLGYEMNNNVYLDLAKELEKLGADWLTLHPRYAKQSFKGVPNYEHLAKLKENVSIPIIASGDLFTAKDGIRVLLETGVDCVMYARGAMANPFIFNQHKILLNHCLEHKIKAEKVPNFEDISIYTEQEYKLLLKELIFKHLDYALKYNSHTALLQMRTIVPRYVKNFENAKALRLALINSKNYEQIVEALNIFFE